MPLTRARTSRISSPAKTPRERSLPIAGTQQTFCDPDSPAGDRVPTCRGGYLDSPLAFDAAEHGIMPRTVSGGEPEQFLILEAATAALADAGLDLADLAGTPRRSRDRARQLLQSRQPYPPSRTAA